MDLVGVIKIILIALIQIASVQNSCQKSNTNVPFKTSFVSSSDYSVRRSVGGGLISLPLSNVETPHQPEALMGGSGYEPSYHEQSYTSMRDPIASSSNTREEVSLNPTSNQAAQNVNLDYQSNNEHYVGNDRASKSSSDISSHHSNYNQEPIVVVEVQASRHQQQPEEPLINTHYSQLDDLVASPSAEMGHNASQLSENNQTSNELQQQQQQQTTSKPILATTIKIETDVSTRKSIEDSPTTVGPSSSSTVPISTPRGMSISNSPTSSTTTTTTIATTTISAGSTTSTEPSPTTTSSPPPPPPPSSPSPPTTNTITTKTIDRSIPTTTQSETYANTTVMARPESSTALASTIAGPTRNMSITQVDQVSTQTSQTSIASTTHPPQVDTSRIPSSENSKSREGKKVQEVANTDRALDQETFSSNRSSVSIQSRSNLCKFGEPNCSYLVASVPILDRWNSGDNESSQGQKNNNNNNTRVVNEFVFVPEDSGLNFEDPTYITRKVGSKDVEPSSLKAEHREIDSEGETSSSLADDIELDYTNPDSDPIRNSEPFMGKSAAGSTPTMGFTSTPKFLSSTISSSYSPTSVSVATTAGQTTPFAVRNRQQQQTTSTTQISPVSATSTTTTASSSSSTSPAPTTTTTTTTVKTSTIPNTTTTTTTMLPTTRRSPPLQSSTSRPPTSAAVATSARPTPRVSQSTSYTVRVSSSDRLTSGSNLPQTTPAALKTGDALSQKTQKPTATRLNQKLLRINEPTQFSETPPQPISRLPAVSSSTTSMPRLLSTSSSTTPAINSAITTSTTPVSARVVHSTSFKPVVEKKQSQQDTIPQVRVRVAQQAPSISRRPKASANSYGEHKQFLSEPVRDLRRKGSHSAVGSNFSPSFNGADDEETKILTRYTIPSQLSRLTAPKSVETKRSIWSNSRAGSTATDNQQSARNKLDQASPSEKLLAVERQILRSSTATTSATSISKDQHSAAVMDKKQPEKRLQMVQTMAKNVLPDDKQLNRQAQASLTVMGLSASSSRSLSNQVGQSQAEASTQVSLFSSSPVSLAKAAEKLETLAKVEDNNRISGQQRNLSNNLNTSQSVVLSSVDKQQLPTTTVVAPKQSQQQSTTELPTSQNKRNVGEVMTLIASSPDSGAMPAQPVAENYSFFSSIGSLNGDYKEEKDERVKEQRLQQQPQLQLQLQPKLQYIRQPDQQVDKIIDLLTSDLAAEKSRSLLAAKASTTPRRVVEPTLETKPVRRLVDEVDDFEGSVEDQLEKDALHSRPQKVETISAASITAPKRSNAYTKAPRQANQNMQLKQQQQQAAALQDSGKWQPSAEDAAGSGSDGGSESGNNSGNLLPGRPGVDYPIHWQVPKTSFDCRNYELSGFYADIESDCQAYHSCHKGRGGRHTFLCPNGTLFSQELLTCDWWYNVECSASKLYLSNEGVDNNSSERVSRGANNNGGASVGAIVEQGSRTAANELSMSS